MKMRSTKILLYERSRVLGYASVIDAFERLGRATPSVHYPCIHVIVENV